LSRDTLKGYTPVKKIKISIPTSDSSVGI